MTLAITPLPSDPSELRAFAALLQAECGALQNDRLDLLLMVARKRGILDGVVGGGCANEVS